MFGRERSGNAAPACVRPEVQHRGLEQSRESRLSVLTSIYEFVR